ncbi:MAG: hypothetical protein EXS08_16945 [Planctomycetes bacterium]|nr:hypothetical protein [Planctomycetota bacterium]
MNPLGLVFLSLAPLVAQSRRVEELIERADVIVVARVEALHPLPGSAPQLVELGVERVLFGAECARVVALPSWNNKSARVLETGKRYVLFLERAPPLFRQGAQLLEFSAAQEKALDELRAGAPLLSWSEDGLWPIAFEHATLPGELLPAEGGPAEVERKESRAHVPEAELLAWLAARIAASLPSISVCRNNHAATRGCVDVQVAPDGTVRGPCASVGVARLDERQLRALWALIEEVRFADLPERVGAPVYIDQSVWRVEVRTRAGRQVVLFFGESIDGSSDAERDASERLQRVLRALPISALTAGAPKK